MMEKHGGARLGAGRPALAVKRATRAMRAFDDEWSLIQRFATLIKSGKIEECRKAVEKMERASE